MGSGVSLLPPPEGFEQTFKRIVRIWVKGSPLVIWQHCFFFSHPELVVQGA